jgi:hypothetical protein
VIEEMCETKIKDKEQGHVERGRDNDGRQRNETGINLR